MPLFSVSHIVDFTLELKRLIKKAFDSNGWHGHIEPELVNHALEKVKSKITANDLLLLEKFFNEVAKIDSKLYNSRLISMRSELDAYSGNSGSKRNPIGYTKPI